MAELLSPAYLAQGCITAQGDRQVLNSLVCSAGYSPGAGGELAVTERGAGANMSVDVASGNAFIEGTDVTWQGMYHVSNDATDNLTITAADGTDDRIDLIVATVRDAQYAGSDNDWLLQVVTGTPSPAPTPPTVPDNSLTLASVLVAAGVTSIVDADITDERVPYELCSAGVIDIQAFTSDGTWTKPANAERVEVLLIGGGGGGGSGRRGAAGSDKYGGGGGGGAGITMHTLDASVLGATEAVVVGAGGTGGAAQTSNSTDGFSGNPGGNTTFAGITAQGGRGGSAGTGAFGPGGNGGGGSQPGGAGADASLGADPTADSYPAGAPGGGAGGSSDSTDTDTGAGSGGDSWAGGTGGGGAGAGGGVGGAGTATTASGPGGGGGGSALAFAGGVGGIYGGGGGGGGFNYNGSNSGAGGTGGSGYAVIVTYSG